jgi:spermidine/putrescine transport system ATP-binding protein
MPDRGATNSLPSTDEVAGDITPSDAPAAVTSVVAVEDVTKRFGSGDPAVDRVSFQVAKSEFFSLLGPSGCGKTTTLRMIAGFETPTSGRIMIEGRDASTVPVNRRNTNLVFQNYALFPHMTIAQNVAFGPERKKLPRKEVRNRVSEVLEAVHLTEYVNRYPRELSGGQQQRVALARALSNRPAVLLLDEPLGALDLKLREGMQFELKRIQREVGISFVYVTHDQGEAMTMSDRIAVMNLGRVEHLGTPEEVYLRPRTLFTAGFIGQANLLEGVIEAKDGSSLLVRLADGSAMRAASGAEGCDVGARATVMVRPEHLRITAEEPAQGAGGLPVRLVEETFQGSWSRYAAETRRGLRVIIHVPSDARLESSAFEGTMWISCDPAHAYVLTQKENTALAEAVDASSESN